MSNLLSRLGRILDEGGIPYMIVGGQAVLLYGEPRLTRDVDVTLGVSTDALPRVLDVAEKAGLRILVDDPEAFVRRTWVLPALDEATGLRVDFIFSWTPYERQAIDRAPVLEVEGTPVRFAAPEDVVIHKLLAGRPRDLSDVRSILRKQTLDLPYLHRWLESFSEALGQDYRAAFDRLWDEVQQEEDR